ncbi:MAG TPA: hypothetical protein VM347_20510 [Nonomuraea sp.]|nr:hypothetical protein [Nonomuraea sp.]
MARRRHGGPGEGSPHGARGKLYVADSHNQVIRELDPATRVVRTVGSVPGQEGVRDGRAAQALFSYPKHVARWSPDGRQEILVITLGYKPEVRTLDLDTGEVATLTTLHGKPGAPSTAGTELLLTCDEAPVLTALSMPRAAESYGFQAVPTMSSPTSALHSVAKLFGTLFCTPTVPHVVLER